MYKKTTNLFAKVLLGCCLLATYSGVWASPEEELAGALKETLLQKTLSYKTTINPEWDGRHEWVRKDESEEGNRGYQVTDDCQKQMEQVSSRLAAMVFLDEQVFNKQFEQERVAFSKLSDGEITFDMRYALLASLAFVPSGTPLESLTDYTNKELQAQFFASGLRFIPTLFWKDSYEVLLKDKSGRGYQFLQSFNGGAEPQAELAKDMGLKMRSAYEANISAKTMNIAKFKPMPQDASSIKLSIEFPASKEDVAQHLWPIMLAVHSGGVEDTSLGELLELSGSIALPADYTEEKLKTSLESYCVKDGRIQTEEDLLMLGVCEGDRNVKAVCRVAMLNVYLRTPGSAGVSRWDRFKVYNDILSMATGADQKNPVYTVKEEWKAETARENLRKGRALRAELQGGSTQ